MREPASRPIQRLLVANRGEIARRVLRSAHAMGIETVAVYSDGDRDAPFVREADQAIALGGRSSAESYLDQQKVLDAARRTHADAVHPGYGFLAENAGFARAVIEAGLVWVGPRPEAIAAMGDKLAAKAKMVEAGVPTLPSREVGADMDPVTAAAEIGYPVLVKASAGGGGKGMRVVEAESGLVDAVAAARREAQAAFGDDTVFLERWLASSRHVEIQLLGDEHGNVVHCFERECSIQRRHQKIVEEAPSPAVDEALRRRMGDAAVAAGQAIGYTSAGTVEFLLDASGDGSGDAFEFWFLEMNTRLQVEHPVTEEITGLDLVREQLRIAQGEPLGFTQDDLALDGHAIEVRLYAEDPANEFLPSTGRIVTWAPATGVEARFESGIESGSVVGIEFDPMLAKVIVHAPTRTEAACRLARVLEGTRIEGPVSNRDQLVAILRSAEFLRGDTTTDFLDRARPATRRSASEEELAESGLIAALHAQHLRRQRARVLTTIPSGWRYTVMPPEEVTYRSGDREILIEYRIRRDGSFWARSGAPGKDSDSAEHPTTEHTVSVHSCTDDRIELEIDGRRLSASVGRHGDRRFVQGPGGAVELVELPRFPRRGPDELTGALVAPMPGKVISTHVGSGDEVEKGELLLVLEAMKMEHRVTAPYAGTITELRVEEGAQVANGELLVVLAEPVEEGS